MTAFESAPVAVEEGWTEVAGCRLRFLKAGERSQRPPLLLIHGLLGYAFSWRFNLPELARETQVFAVDLPGVGLSGRKTELDCHARALAKILHGFLREFDLGPLDVLGTSHGGGVAIMLAALGQTDAHAKVRRLVLSAPVNPWSRHGQLITRMLGTRVGAFGFKRCEPILAHTHGWALRRMYGRPSRMAEGTLEGYAKPLRIPGTLDHVLGIVKCWHEDLREIETALPQIADIPTLLIWGARDGAVLPDSATRLRASFRRAELVVFPDAGHLPYEEVPDEFNRVVSDFLGRK
jgi:pimeloyl-ACP methyl ester carboxylesterase